MYAPPLAWKHIQSRYAAGPPLGGFLYAVEYLYCLYYCCTVVSVGVRVCVKCIHHI